MARRVGLAIFLAVFGCVIFSTSASAWSFGTPGAASILDSIVNNPGTYATKHDATGTGTTRVDSYSASGRIIMTYSPGGSGNQGYVQDLSVKTGLNIPANSIGRLNFIIEGNGDTIIDVNPFNLQGDDILQQNCDVLASKRDSNNLEKPTKLYCSVLIYKITRGTTLTFSANLFGFTNSGFKIFLPTNYNWIEVTDDSGGGNVNISQIETDVQNILVQAQNSNLLLNDIKTLLNQVKTQGQAQQQTIETAIQNALDDEKDDYEQQSQDNETTINSDSSAAQGAATTLLGVVGQFISTLTSAQPTNCNLDGSLIPHLNLGTLNLCTYQMPAALTVLGSLVLIAFVVPLAYHTVKRMLALIGSFQN